MKWMKKRWIMPRDQSFLFNFIMQDYLIRFVVINQEKEIKVMIPPCNKRSYPSIPPPGCATVNLMSFDRLNWLNWSVSAAQPGSPSVTKTRSSLIETDIKVINWRCQTLIGNLGVSSGTSLSVPSLPVEPVLVNQWSSSPVSAPVQNTGADVFSIEAAPR